MSGPRGPCCPSKLLIAPNGQSVGPASLDISVANGVTSASFGVMALESAAPLPSTVAITSSAQGFTDGTLDASKTYLSALQAVRIGGPTLTATVTSSSPTAAELVTLSGSASTATLQLGPGSHQTGNKSQGGVELDPLAAGSTTLSVGIPRLLTLPSSQSNTTVTP